MRSMSRCYEWLDVGVDVDGKMLLYGGERHLNGAQEIGNRDESPIDVAKTCNSSESPRLVGEEVLCAGFKDAMQARFLTR